MNTRRGWVGRGPKISHKYLTFFTKIGLFSTHVQYSDGNKRNYFTILHSLSGQGELLTGEWCLQCCIRYSLIWTQRTCRLPLYLHYSHPNRVIYSRETNTWYMYAARQERKVKNMQRRPTCLSSLTLTPPVHIWNHKSCFQNCMLRVQWNSNETSIGSSNIFYVDWLDS
jgi:hypothetical protein